MTEEVPSTCTDATHKQRAEEVQNLVQLLHFCFFFFRLSTRQIVRKCVNKIQRTENLMKPHFTPKETC